MGNANSRRKKGERETRRGQRLEATQQRAVELATVRDAVSNDNAIPTEDKAFAMKLTERGEELLHRGGGEFVKDDLLAVLVELRRAHGEASDLGEIAGMTCVELRNAIRLLVCKPDELQKRLYEPPPTLPLPTAPYVPEEYPPPPEPNVSPEVDVVSVKSRAPVEAVVPVTRASNFRGEWAKFK